MLLRLVTRSARLLGVGRASTMVAFCFWEWVRIEFVCLVLQEMDGCKEISGIWVGYMSGGHEVGWVCK